METTDCGLLVIGAGHAGSELALAARQGGWPGRIVLAGDEDGLPYQRPPLSKVYLLGRSDVAALELRSAAAYEAAAIERMPGVRMVALDRVAHTVTLADGRTLRYDKLALCTGGRPRPLTCAGLDAAHSPVNLAYLRTRADADSIRAALQPNVRIMVVGGGYVGLEVAASARGQGAQVTVLESQPRVLARVAGEPVSRFYEDVHRQAGVTVLTGAGVSRMECDGARIVAVHTSTGQRLPADLVVAGIGMLPNIEAARETGLALETGIPVDALARTADPDIVAAGDCTVQHDARYDLTLRLESVPNALEQARAAASWLVGQPKPNRSVPWFWSDQYDLKLQMAGLAQGHDRCVLRGDPATRSFCAFYLQGDRLLAVDAVNRPADFMAVRRALTRDLRPRIEALADASFPLKELLVEAEAAAQPHG
ncbi:MAG: hypothetical protein RI884_1623 [Pseudomonadota bacterium]|jgi:3-phenylpropionate/trans-cinnamate dioxygenase ferredoxin reductase subunit